MNLDFLKTKFPNVFDGDYTGTIKGHVAHIVMAENASPIFCGAYTVPYGMRPKVEEEIDRLVKCEILEPVTYSEFADGGGPKIKWVLEALHGL